MTHWQAQTDTCPGYESPLSVIATAVQCHVDVASAGEKHSQVRGRGGRVVLGYAGGFCRARLVA